MKERHIEFLIRFHKPSTRQLNLLSDCRVVLNSDLDDRKDL